MRVRELAVDLRVNADVLLRFLRESGVRVGHTDAFIRDTDVAKVRTRLERERRAGHGEAADVMSAVVKAHKPTSRRRRRRRRRVVTPIPSEPVEVLLDESVAADGGVGPEAAETAAPVVTAEVSGADAQVDTASAVEEARAADTEAVPSAESEVEDPVIATPPVESAQPESVPEPPTSPSVDAGGISLDTAGISLDTAGISLDTAGISSDTAIPPLAAQAPDVEPEPAIGAAGGASPIMPARTGPKPSPAREGAPGGLAPVGKPEPAASAGPGGKVRIQAEGYTSDGRRKRERKRGKRRRGTDRDKAKENIQRVMAEIKGGRKKRRKGKSAVAAAKEERVAAQERAAEQVAAEASTVRVNEFLTVAELAELVDASATEIIGSAFRNMGLMVTINQRLDFDQIEMLLEGFGYKAVREMDYLPPGEVIEEDDPVDLRPRPPVVTVMGTSITARRSCWTGSATPTSWRARPVASRSTSARTTSSSTMAAPSRSWTHPATPPSRPCEPGEPT